MKKDQIKCNSKAMKGRGNGVAGKVVRIQEPRYEGNAGNVHANIEAAFADLKNEYKKSGPDK